MNLTNMRIEKKKITKQSASHYISIDCIDHESEMCVRIKIHLHYTHTHTHTNRFQMEYIENRFDVYRHQRSHSGDAAWRTFNAGNYVKMYPKFMLKYLNLITNTWPVNIICITTKSMMLLFVTNKNVTQWDESYVPAEFAGCFFLHCCSSCR